MTLLQCGNANDNANMLRNANGEAAQFANVDIANVAQQAETANPTTPTNSGTLQAPNNYSSYINDLYSAKESAALSELESAYNNNVATLDASKATIAPTYQASRNQTAATSEQEKRNFCRICQRKWAELWRWRSS